VSTATALARLTPLGSAVVSKLAAYGAEASDTVTPPSVKSTRETPALSLAAAVNVAFPVSRTPGAVSVTVGLRMSLKTADMR
jgi:hypothetical protein